MKKYSSLKEKEQYFTCYTIKSLDQLKLLLTKFENSKNIKMVFRGVNEACYYNYPSALVRLGDKTPQNDFDELIARSIDAVWRNKRLRKMLSKRSNDRTDMQALSLLQHYGFGTTILDFSYDFNHSVFFAFDGMSYTPHAPKSTEEIDDINDFVSIYMFNIKDPEHKPFQEVLSLSKDQLEDVDLLAKKQYGKLYTGLSQQTKDSYSRMPYRELAKTFVNTGISIAGRYGGAMDIVSPSTGLFVTYDVSNDRNDKQYGLFKLTPSSNKPYEEIALQFYSGMPEHLFCINIHKSLKYVLTQEYLTPHNICRDTVYPRTKFYNKAIRELLTIPFENDKLVAPARLVNLKHCTYRKLRNIAKKRSITSQKP